MADQDRRIKRESWKESFWVVEAPVHGGTTIEKGDLIFLDQANGLRTRGASTADFYAYPFSKLSGSTLTLASNKNLAANNFLGVAANWSRHGVTEQIGIYVSGLFKFPLKNSRAVKTGYYVSPAGSGVTLYNQYVSISSSTSYAIGRSGNVQDFASDVELVVLSRLFGTAIGLF